MEAHCRAGKCVMQRPGFNLLPGLTLPRKFLTLAKFPQKMLPASSYDSRWRHDWRH